MKHFEELWIAAEKSSQRTKISTENLFYYFHLLLKEDKNEEASKLMGKILYLLCSISNQKQINVFAALLQEMQDQEVDFLEKE